MLAREQKCKIGICSSDRAGNQEKAAFGWRLYACGRAYEVEVYEGYMLHFDKMQTASSVCASSQPAWSGSVYHYKRDVNLKFFEH